MDREGTEELTLFLDGPYFVEGFCSRENWSWSPSDLFQLQIFFFNS